MRTIRDDSDIDEAPWFINLSQYDLLGWGVKVPADCAEAEFAAPGVTVEVRKASGEVSRIVLGELIDDDGYGCVYKILRG